MIYIIAIMILSCVNFTQAQSPFLGGVGSGAMSLALGGADTCIHFYGGQDGSGVSNAQYTNPYNCDMFLGDTMSAYSKNGLSTTQNCIFFKGNIASGYSEDFYDNPASCPAFYASASGNDGYATRSYSDEVGSCHVLSLPIEASPLFAKIEGQKGYLYWTTYTEYNNMGFEIQKSFDAIHWERIGWIDGAGDHQGDLSYEFWDDNLQYTNQYYRFIQVDYDNTQTISNTVNLHPSQTTQNLNHIAIYPNPVESGRFINIRTWIGYELEGEILLYNTLGQLIQQESFFFDEYNSLKELPIQNVVSGHYFLVLIDKGGNVITNQKLVILP